MSALDKTIFHFGDRRCQYSLNQIQSLIDAGASTTADSPVYIHEIAFRAEDVLRTDLTLHEVLALAIDE
jgi:hypothetical protein